LVKKFAALELGLDEDMLSYRLRQLTLLLPDMSEFVLQHYDATDEGARIFWVAHLVYPGSAANVIRQKSLLDNAHAPFSAVCRSSLLSMVWDCL